MKHGITRFEEEGIKGLLNKPRGQPKPVSDDVEDKIIVLKRENPHRSTRRIRDLLRNNEDISLHRQTIRRTLKKVGENKRARKQMKVFRDFERIHPNSLWQVDYMDAIVVEGIDLVYLILFVDDYSRKIIGEQFVENRSAFHVLELL